ncbi:hypothetical protein K8R30_01715 [archaeon]|nr:hypothetical protein [archaeon]
MVEVKFGIKKRDFFWMGLIVILLGVGLGYAYGTSDPVVFGHSVDEFEIDDAFCNRITGADCGNISEGKGIWTQRWTGSGVVPNEWGTGLYVLKTSSYYVTMSLPRTDIDSVSHDYSDSNRCYYTAASQRFSCDGAITEVWEWVSSEAPDAGTLDCTTATCSTGWACTATCPSGYTMTGGGGNPNTNGDLILSLPSGNGWQCGLARGGSCYARCCKIN